MEEKKETRGQQELRERVIAAGLCTGCGACINLCPYFRSYKGKQQFCFLARFPRGDVSLIVPRSM